MYHTVSPTFLVVLITLDIIDAYLFLERYQHNQYDSKTGTMPHLMFHPQSPLTTFQDTSTHPTPASTVTEGDIKAQEFALSECQDEFWANPSLDINIYEDRREPRVSGIEKFLSKRFAEHEAEIKSLKEENVKMQDKVMWLEEVLAKMLGKVEQGDGFGIEKGDGLDIVMEMKQ